MEVLKDEADKGQFDATEIRGKDPNFVYRWARCGPQGEDTINITRHELNGYEIVKKSTEASILSDRTRMKKGEDTDDTIRWGDMILMRIPREKFEDRLARERAKIYRQTKGVAEAYKSSIARIAASEDNAFEEHKANPGMTTVSSDEKMTQGQMEQALKVASGIEEDIKGD